MGKHVDVVNSKEIFETNLSSGMYTAPWVVYIKTDDGNYDVIYSTEQNRVFLDKSNFSDLINKRIENLETEKVYCYESEYDELVANPDKEVIITNINGEKIAHKFDETKLYCIYEDDGPIQDEITDSETSNENTDTSE